MKTVIVDTNVLVSAILNDRSPELVIQCIVENPEIEWVASPINSFKVKLD